MHLDIILWKLLKSQSSTEIIVSGCQTQMEIQKCLNIKNKIYELF